MSFNFNLASNKEAVLTFFGQPLLSFKQQIDSYNSIFQIIH